MSVCRFVNFLSRDALVLRAPELNTTKRCSNSSRREVLETVMVRTLHTQSMYKAGKRTKISFLPFVALETDLLTSSKAAPPFDRKQSNAAASTVRHFGRGYYSAGDHDNALRLVASHCDGPPQSPGKYSLSRAFHVKICPGCSRGLCLDRGASAVVNILAVGLDNAEVKGRPAWKLRGGDKSDESIMYHKQGLEIIPVLIDPISILIPTSHPASSLALGVTNNSLLSV